MTKEVGPVLHREGPAGVQTRMEAVGVTGVGSLEVLLEGFASRLHAGETEREQSREMSRFPAWKAGVIVSCSYPIGWSEVKGQVEGRAFYLGHV